MPDYVNIIHKDAVLFVKNWENKIAYHICHRFEYDDGHFDYFAECEVRDILSEEILDTWYPPDDAIFVLENCLREADSSVLCGNENWREMLSILAAHSLLNDVQQEVDDILKCIYNHYTELVAAISVDKKPDAATLNSTAHAAINDIVSGDEIKPLKNPGGIEEIALIEKWISLSYAAGSFAGYPLGQAYLDGRCGPGYGMPNIYDYIEFDHIVAKRLPHLFGWNRSKVVQHLHGLKCAVEMASR